MIARVILLCLALLLSGCGDSGPGREEPVVLAAASLQEVLEEAADAWTAKGKPRPTLSFAATPVIARQVLEGSPADMVVTADAEWMDELAEAKAIQPGSRRNIAGNALVMIGAPGSDGTFAPPMDGGPFLIIADPKSVPAGRYAVAALESAGLAGAVAGRTAYVDSVRAALRLVETGEVPFGIVYKTDALASGKVREIFQFPPGSHKRILYPAALVKGTDKAAGFLAFLASNEGQAIFARHGFAPAPQ